MRSEFADRILEAARSRTESVEISRSGIAVVAHPGVYPTGELSEVFLECMDSADIGLKNGEHVLDYGCGTGFLAIAAAKKGAASVLAVDINPNAVACAQENVERHNLQFVVEVKHSNAFDGISPDRKFDLILAGMPFEAAPVNDVFERSVYDPNFEMRRALFDRAAAQLSERGRIFTSYSERVQRKAPLEDFDPRYVCEIVGERVIKGDLNFIFMVCPKR
jgi:methylase of polypeptide subunit release factors